MSFYNDASLVFLPSGGAGKDGKAYSIKPVPEYGTNLVTNGGFDTDSDWVKGAGWTISGGTANCDGTQTSTSQLRTSVGLSIQNTLVKFSFEVKNYSAGTLTATIEGTGGNEFSGINSNGVYTIQATSSDSTPRIAFNANSSFIGSIDNISVREVVVEDGDFTFSRGANLAATRVDSNGLIEKGRENLLLQSNQFDTTWATIGTSVTSGQSGYDGSSDAWLLESNNTGGAYISQNLTASGVQTFSIYAKAGTCNFIYFVVRGSTNIASYFDLENGTIGTAVATNIDRKIESVGGGWYRCSITLSNTDTSVRIYMADADGSTTSAVGSNIYIQDAQLEIGLTGTEYIESGATKGKAGILEDSPRFDYSGGASCPSLLLEPSRTNIVPNSEGIADSETQVTTTINYKTSPEGVINALKVQKNGNSENDRLFPIGNGNATLVSGTDYSLSAFIKDVDMTNGAVTTIGCRVDGGTLFRQGYEWNNGTLSTTTYNQSGTRTSVILEDYGSGWYRVGFSFEANGTSGNFEMDIDRVNGSATTSIQTYGWQFCEGSYPTSYIPNHSGGSVTREVETARGLFNGDSIFDSDWTAFCELVVPNVGGDLTGAGFVLKSVEGSTSTADRVAVLVHESNSQLELIFYDGTTQQQIAFNYTFGDTLKIAIRNDSAYFINGTKYTTTMVLQEPVEIAYGRAGQADSSVGETANIKQTLVFPSALSDVECITLTS